MIAIVDRDPHVADVPVERVAVQQQEEDRQHQQDDERAPIAHDLTELLAGNGKSLAHG